MTKPLSGNRLIDDEDDAAEEDAPTARFEEVALAPSETRRPRKITGAGSYPGRRQVTGYIDKSLFLWYKAYSAKMSIPLVQLFDQALQAYAKSIAAQKKFGAR